MILAPPVHKRESSVTVPFTNHQDSCMADIVLADGTVNACAGTVLSPGLSEEDCEERGLAFFRTYKVPPPSTLHSLSPCDIAGHTVYFTLRFKNDHLWQVSFTFVESDDDERKKLDVYKEYLKRGLGSPTESSPDNPNISYVFPWGQITASYDPRNDSSGIYVSWGTPKELAAND